MFNNSVFLLNQARGYFRDRLIYFGTQMAYDSFCPNFSMYCGPSVWTGRVRWCASGFIGFVYTERVCCFHLFGLTAGPINLFERRRFISCTRATAAGRSGRWETPFDHIERRALSLNIGAKRSRNINKRLRARQTRQPFENTFLARRIDAHLS